MATNLRREFPAELCRWQETIEKTARSYGLDFFETIFELLGYEEMNTVAAYGGFPTRYPHWRFGMEYEQLTRGYAYGLQKIYEMVINNNPCYAYLLESNSVLAQKLVMAHVYGHGDFFKNNIWFAHTNRKMIDVFANHGARSRTGSGTSSRSSARRPTTSPRRPRPRS
jgi:stage V sporulation protein R